MIWSARYINIYKLFEKSLLRIFFEKKCAFLTRPMRAAVRPNRDKFLLSCNEMACSKSYLKMAATLQTLPFDFTTSIFSFSSHIPRFKVRVNRL